MAETRSFRANPPEPGPPRRYSFPVVDRSVLANGLRLLFVRVESAPVVSVRAVVRQGADHDPSERPGLASFVAEMIDEGTKSRTALDIATEIGDLGASLHSGCDWDSSYLMLDVLTRNLRAGLEVFAEVLTRPAFDDKEIERIRRERQTMILQNQDDPSVVASEAFARLVYRGTPCQNPIIGNAESLAKLTRDELVEFHRDNYSPRSTSLVITGEFDPAEVRSNVRELLGDWHDDSEPGEVSFRPPPIETSRITIVDRPQAVQTEIRVGHPGVDRSTKDYFAIIVMNAILGGVFTSRLNLNLREKNGFTYHVRSGFSMRRNPGSFNVSAAVRTEVTADAIKEILFEIERMQSGDLEPNELNEASNFMMGVFPATLQTASNLATRLEDMEIYSLPDDWFDNYRERIGAVDSNAVVAAAKKYLNPKKVVIVAAGNASEIKDSLESLGMPVDVEGL